MSSLRYIVGAFSQIFLCNHLHNSEGKCNTIHYLWLQPYWQHRNECSNWVMCSYCLKNRLSSVCCYCHDKTHFGGVHLGNRQIKDPDTPNHRDTFSVEFLMLWNHEIDTIWFKSSRVIAKAIFWSGPMGALLDFLQLIKQFVRRFIGSYIFKSEIS